MALLPLDNANAYAKAKESEHIITSGIKEKRPRIYKAPQVQSRKRMEEMMMVMMKIRSHENNSTNNNLNIPIPTSITCPTWKLYENPFYISNHKPPQTHHHHHQQQQNLQIQDHQDNKQIHKLHLPVSARKIAASFWDLTFINPYMETELELARTQINELKAELERNCKARKKMGSLNKRLARELSEERKGREALERVCEALAKEITSNQAAIDRMKKEMDEERKMMRTAEVIREERVQMKLAEAKILLEEKFSELEVAKKIENNKSSSSSILSSSVKKEENSVNTNGHNQTSFGEKLRFVLGNVGNAAQSMAVMQRKACPEAENPHIKRGIKGFVEFPKVVRAIGCKSSKHLGSKLECQKAQLNVLLKQKGHVRFNGLIAS